jgi:hypothetical protein
VVGRAKGHAMTDGTDDDRAAYVRNLIANRCPELGAADLAAFTQHATTPVEPDLPEEIGRDLMAVLEAMDMKLDRMADAVGVNGEDDDAGRRR